MELTARIREMEGITSAYAGDRNLWMPWKMQAECFLDTLFRLYLFGKISMAIPK